MDPVTASLLINGGILGGSYVYHRWINPPDKPRPLRKLNAPRVDEGAPIPMLYGRCRVHQPILAWASPPDHKILDNLAIAHNTVPEANSYSYGANLFFVLGKTMEGQSATIHKIWASDSRLVEDPIGMASTFGGPSRLYVTLGDLVGNADGERGVRRCRVHSTVPGTFLTGEVELMNGRVDQRLVNTIADTTWAAEKMIEYGVDGTLIPGYRGMVCMFLGGLPVEDDDTEDAIEEFVDEIPDGFNLGLTTNVPPISVETWSITQSPVGTTSVVNAGDGAIELNPMDCAFDLLTGQDGKLGISPTRIDRTGTFRTAANTLADEGIGMSRNFEEGTTGRDAIGEIERLVDCIFYEDPADGLVKVKLIRGDFDPTTAREITPSNGEIERLELTGTTVPITSVRAAYNSRAAGYSDDSEVAPNEALGATFNQTNEVLVQFPACCTKQMAATLASRELTFLSRPLIKATVVVDRSFIRIVPGDVVSLRSAELGIGGKIFRVAAVERGTLADGRIRLHLLEDIYFVHRDVVEHERAPVFER